MLRCARSCAANTRSNTRVAQLIQDGVGTNMLMACGEVGRM